MVAMHSRTARQRRTDEQTANASPIPPNEDRWQYRNRNAVRVSCAPVDSGRRLRAECVLVFAVRGLQVDAVRVGRRLGRGVAGDGAGLQASRVSDILRLTAWNGTHDETGINHSRIVSSVAISADKSLVTSPGRSSVKNLATASSVRSSPTHNNTRRSRS